MTNPVLSFNPKRLLGHPSSQDAMVELTQNGITENQMKTVKKVTYARTYTIVMDEKKPTEHFDRNTIKLCPTGKPNHSTLLKLFGERLDIYSEGLELSSIIMDDKNILIMTVDLSKNLTLEQFLQLKEMIKDINVRKTFEHNKNMMKVVNQ